MGIETQQQSLLEIASPVLTGKAENGGITILNRLDEDAWRGFVEQHPQGSIFHTPEMFQVFSRTKRVTPSLWAAAGDGGQVLALLCPVQITLNPLLREVTSRAVCFGSVLCDPSEEGRHALEMLLNTYARQAGRTCLFTELRNLACLEELQPLLQRSGFAYEPHLNYLIDLDRPPEAIFESFGKRTRKNIRHALNKGEVTIREITDRSEIPLCYRLLQRTYQAARVPLVDISQFEAAFDVLYPKEMIRFTLAAVGETPAAASVELLYKDVVYGWFGGMDRAYSGYLPNELLMWHILEWSSRYGFRLYDFGGAGKPDEEYSVRDFKAKFGGDLVSYGRNTCVHRPGVLRLSTSVYQLSRFLFSGGLHRE